MFISSYFYFDLGFDVGFDLGFDDRYMLYKEF